jgi:hypothetical protein
MRMWMVVLVGGLALVAARNATLATASVADANEPNAPDIAWADDANEPNAPEAAWAADANDPNKPDEPDEPDGR